MSQNSEEDSTERDEVLTLYRKGYNPRDIAEDTGLNIVFVKDTIKKFKGGVVTPRRPRMGRPRMFTPEEERQMSQIFKDNSNLNVYDMHVKVQEALGKSFGLETTRRFMKQCTFLNTEHRILRQNQESKRYEYLGNRRMKTLYDSRGFINGVDSCDCLDQTCPGCHFPCPKCSSSKCGTECRVNRRWAYEKVDIEGTAP